VAIPAMLGSTAGSHTKMPGRWVPIRPHFDLGPRLAAGRIEGSQHLAVLLYVSGGQDQGGTLASELIRREWR